MILSGIYCIEHTPSGNKYIGSASNIRSRWGSHRSSLRKGTHYAKFLQRSWNRYGEDQFFFRVIEWCDKSRLIEREQFYIDSYKPKFNSCPIAGSPSVRPISQATREKIMKSSTGRKHSDETKLKCSLINKGRKHTPEHREKWRKKVKGRKQSPEERKMRSEAQKGRKVSQETRKKIAQKLRGGKRSDESRRKMSIAASNRNSGKFENGKMEFCKNGHKRTPDNLRANGACIQCSREYGKERWKNLRK